MQDKAFLQQRPSPILLSPSVGRYTHLMQRERNAFSESFPRQQETFLQYFFCSLVVAFVVGLGSEDDERTDRAVRISQAPAHHEGLVTQRLGPPVVPFQPRRHGQVRESVGDASFVPQLAPQGYAVLVQRPGSRVASLLALYGSQTPQC